MRFLRIFPYAYYFCRKAGGCDCRSLDHKFKARRACHNCGCVPCLLAGYACLLHLKCQPVAVHTSCLLEAMTPGHVFGITGRLPCISSAHLRCGVSCLWCCAGTARPATTAGGTSMWPTPSRRGDTAARGALRCACSRCAVVWTGFLSCDLLASWQRSSRLVLMR